MNNPYSHLSEDERMEKIAELLLIGAERYFRKHPEFGRPAAPVVVPRKIAVWDLVSDETDKAILQHLHAAVQSSPAQIGEALGIPRSSLARHMTSLRAAGLVQTSGKTSNARWELAGKSARN